LESSEKIVQSSAKKNLKTVKSKPVAASAKVIVETRVLQEKNKEKNYQKSTKVFFYF